MATSTFVKNTLALVIGATLSVSAFAKPGQSGDRPSTDGPSNGKGYGAIFKRLDTNQDKQIDLTEHLAMIEKKITAIFTKADQNEDGLLTLEEFTTLGEKRREIIGEHGEALRECMEEKRADNDAILVPEARDYLSVEEKFAELDLNNDGFLEWSELEHEHATIAEQRFNAADSDDDGFVSVKEFVAAAKRLKATRKAMRECYREVVAAKELVDGDL